jgi:poly(3-hydroxybutyrate) depolymerase
MRLIILPIALFFLPLFFSCSKSNNASVEPLTNQQNIQYGSAPDSGGVQEALLMDIYFPAGATTGKKYPLVLFIHGGGFVQGNKEDVRRHCEILADSGFVAATISYRLGWRKGTGNCDGDTLSKRMAVYRAVQDAHAALRYLVSKAADYAIETNHIFIGGSSAGAGISLMTAYFNDAIAQQSAQAERSILGAINTSGNHLTNPFTIKGIANLWGALPDSNLISSPTAIPMISFHGTNDGVVPYDNGYANGCTAYSREFGSACLTRQLYSAKVPFLLHLKQGAGHGPDLYSATYTMSRTVPFFKNIINSTTITSKVFLD